MSLNLEFAVITDLALELLGKPEKLPRLRELGLAGCLGLSEGGLRRLLCGEGAGMGIGVGVEVLDLRWGMDVRVEWVEGWLQRRQASNVGGRIITGSVDVCGCERVTSYEVEALRRKWLGVEIKFNPKKRRAVGGWVSLVSSRAGNGRQARQASSLSFPSHA